MTDDGSRPASRGRLWQRLLGSLLVLALVFGVLGGIGWAKYRQIQIAMAAPPPPEMAVAVTTSVATSAPYQASTVVVGTLMAPQFITVRNELTGVVTEVAMTSGGSVAAGDVLVKLDTEIEEAQLGQALAEQKLAAAELDRNRTLARRGAGSDADLEAAAAKATVSTAEVRRLRTMIAKKTLVAPFDASVGVFDLYPGQFLDVGTEIAMLHSRDDHVIVDFAAPAAAAASVQMGTRVEVSLADSSREPVIAKVFAIDSSADPLTRSLRARARWDSPPPTARPGESVRVTMDYGQAAEVVMVPATAIRRTPEGVSVFVVQSDGEVDRAVEVAVVIAGAGDGASVPLAKTPSGVIVGDRVVADGSFKLSDGSTVAEADSPSQP